jgi:hypothetical protein
MEQSEPGRFIPDDNARRTTISQPTEISPATLRLRLNLRDTPPVGSLVNATVPRLAEWIESMQAADLKVHSTSTEEASNPIEHLADTLIPPGTGIERQLLLKALQEALLYYVDFDISLTTEQVASRLRQSLDGPGSTLFMKRFLALYLSNHMWFHASELFQRQAQTPQKCGHYLQQLDQICEESVVVAYEQVEVVDPGSVKKLVQRIEQQIRGL